jgi:hypothetical protein
MYFRLILSTIVLLAVAAHQPGVAKDGHAQHSGRASAINNGASGKGASGTSPPAAKASVPIDAEATVAPPVLPPHGVTQQQIRTINPSGKNPSSKTPANSVSRATTGATTVSPARNAIGQPVVPSQPPVPALQRSGAVSAPIIHRGPVPAPVASGAAPVNGANAVNRVSINGATVVRPANAPVIVGGPAVARYGINGTTVQNKH